MIFEKIYYMRIYYKDVNTNKMLHSTYNKVLPLLKFDVIRVTPFFGHAYLLTADVSGQHGLEIGRQHGRRLARSAANVHGQI
jgi:hypothetical protein